ncbi:YopX family protein [Persephonella sp.]
MREIKFKIYDTKIKKNITFLCFFQRLIELYMTGKLNESEAVELTVSDKDLVLVQFTGLKDKNCKEVFEGDIVKDNTGQLFVVEWDNNFACFRLGHKYLTDFGNPSFFVGNELEVIGNIYTNPELLKEV